jgi:phage/plasmid-associated DNA primase
LGYTNAYRTENDAIAKFITDKIVLCENGEPVDKAYLRRVFKEWKDDDNRGLLFADLEKRLVEKFGKFPSGGWTCFKVT